jgi:hypothetical protein
VLYVKQGPIYRVRTTPGVPQDSIDRGLKPFIKQFGTQSSPRLVAGRVEDRVREHPR